MKYPTLYEQASSRQVVEVFGGYNRNLRIGDGEFRDMENMTSDYYPVLAPRGKRGNYHLPTDDENLIMYESGELVELAGPLTDVPGALSSKGGQLHYTQGQYFVRGNMLVDLGLDPREKQIVGMGAYDVIMPDGKYINAAFWNFEDGMEYGNLGTRFEIAATEVEYTLCDIEGNAYADAVESQQAPEDPGDKDYWVDTSDIPYVLKQYSHDTGMWITVPTTYVKIAAEGIAKDIKKYDGVTLSGVGSSMVEDGESVIVWNVDEESHGYIVVVGTPALEVLPLERPNLIVERMIPHMDFVVECGNRLWGCAYYVATDASSGVKIGNQIYASKLGDFKNWNCFMGISTDSWAATVGTDGPFTGAVAYNGTPIFFKENCMHRVYGSDPSSFRIQTTNCRGVQEGSGKSLAVINEVLYYKSSGGVMAYDGSLPTDISYALGKGIFKNAVAGAVGGKYYVSMQDESGVYSLFVYDTAKDLWHREDGLRVIDFCTHDGELYAINGNTGKIITMLGSGEADTKDVEWMAETGEIGLSSPDMKYISRLTIRMMLAIGAEVRISAQYDFSNTWEELATLRGKSLRSFALPVRPKRCDHMRLRIEGQGTARIYSITKTMEQGSDIS